MAKRRGGPVGVCPNPLHAGSSVVSNGRKLTQSGPRQIFACTPAGGQRHFFIARTVEKASPGYPMPRHTLSLMLACDALHADRTVYAAGLDVTSAAPAVPVGPNCRLCARRDCAYRQEAPIIGA